jgi:hypothetical protein
MHEMRNKDPQQVAIWHGLWTTWHAISRIWIWTAVAITAIQVGVCWFAIGFESSVWLFVHGVSSVMLGVFGIIMMPMFFSMYIANGMTRRNFIIGGAVFVVSLSLVIALLQTIGFGIEELAYGAAGIKDVLDRPLVFDSASDGLRVFAICFTTYIAYMVSGWLCGTGYKAFGPVIGTVLIPVAAIPLLLNDFILSEDWGWSSAVNESVRDVLPVGVACLIVLAVAAAGIWVNYRVARDVAIT